MSWERCCRAFRLSRPAPGSGIAPRPPWSSCSSGGCSGCSEPAGSSAWCGFRARSTCPISWSLSDVDTPNANQRLDAQETRESGVKIAIVSTMAGSPWGGSEDLWALMAQEALAAGHQVAISVYRWPTAPPKLARLARQGARVSRRRRSRWPSVETVATRLLQRPLALPARLPWPSAFQALADFRPDVICISQGNTYGALDRGDLLRWLRRAAAPYVVVSQANDEVPIASGLRRQAIPFWAAASRLVFVSSHNLQAAEHQLARHLANGVVVQNPVNIDDQTPVPWPPPGPVRLANVGRLQTDAKGQDVLFAALSTPAWRDRPWQLSLFGEGPDKEYLQTLADHYAIAGRVAFRGQVGDIRAIWAESDLLVLPSRVEGTPLALVEAMLCGRPAVVTDVGGNG